jgi:ligand-binding sensor domain-containing protein
VCVFVLAGLACLNLSAQEYHFRYFGIAEGLTNLAVRQIYEDRAGFVWVSTENGIFRFDGERFEEFTEPPTESNSVMKAEGGMESEPYHTMFAFSSLGRAHRYDALDSPGRACRQRLVVAPDRRCLISRDRYRYSRQRSRTTAIH